MDFLDPKRKKAHRRRLLLGYILMAIAIALAAYLLLLTALGYDYDRKTGSVIQNGIMYVDTKPGNAKVFVNNKQQGSNTATRLNLPAGQYTLKLELDGYKTWTRTFYLDGGKIQRLVYPLLIPNSLKVSDVQLYATQPALASPSPDRHWIIVQQPGQPLAYDLFDTTNINGAATTLTVPASIVTQPETTTAMKVIEWSNDNRHILFQRSYAEGKTEFLMIDRQDPALSVNINSVLGISPTIISLRNKKPDQLYFIEGTTADLRSGDLKSKTISAPLVSSVLNYKTYGDDVILYATQKDVEAGRTNFRIYENGKTYSLKTVPQGSVYLVEVSKYNNNWYYAVGSDADDAVFLYRNPLDTLKGKNGNALSVVSVLRVENPQFVSFSANVQFLSVQSGKNIVTYDIEDDRQFTIRLAQNIPLTQQLEWMDGHRLAYVAGGKSYIVDFDGSNRQQLTAAVDGLSGPFFDRDYENMMTVAPSASVNGRFSLTTTPLINK